MLNLDENIEKYLESKRGTWANSTLLSERARLNYLKPFIDGNPETLLKGMLEKGLKQYTQKIGFIRISDFLNFLIDAGLHEGPNLYSKFQRRNRRFFKNAYKKMPSRFTMAECEAKIKQIENVAHRNRALILLHSGCRYTESLTISDGQIVGKGGKVRPYFGPPLEGKEIYNGCYSAHQKQLQRVGLKSHDLRKAIATHLADKGLNEYDMCRMFGWANIQTATSYVRPKKDAELKSYVERMLGNARGDIRKSV